MDRDEATGLVKEIISNCQIMPDAIMLMPPNADDVLSQGYQVHIKSGIDPQSESCMRQIAEKRQLAISNDVSKNLVVIYKPMRV